MTRSVAYITGTRADYGLFSKALAEIAGHQDLELQLLVTAMHLEERFGLTVREIEADGWPIAARVPSIDPADDSGAGQGLAIAAALSGLIPALSNLRPDVVIVLGDRGEALAGALAAAHLGIPVAHVHGGDVSGTVDDLLRHAITKVSHLHFTATEDAAERVRRLGEEPSHVWTVGAPGLDVLRTVEPASDEEITDWFEFDARQPLVLFTLHPVTVEADQGPAQMDMALAALERTGAQVIATYPNADGGGRAMIDALERYRGRPWLRIEPSLGARYPRLLARASAVAGNSSSGIIEAGFFGIPVVNIGSRQFGRVRGGNVIDAGWAGPELDAALKSALRDRAFIERAREARSPYGDGHAGERIARLLATQPLDRELLLKRITY